MHSYLFPLSSKSEDLIEQARCLNLQQVLSLICYDNGSMHKASSVYWALKAAGFTNVKVLYGGLQACKSFGLQFTSQVPVAAPRSGKMLEFNFGLVMTKREFIKANTADYLSVSASLVGHGLYMHHRELNRENIGEFLKKCGVGESIGERVIIYGESSCLLGVLLEYMNQGEKIIVFEDFNEPTRKEITSSKSACSSTIYVSLSESEMEDQLEKEKSPDKGPEEHYMHHVSTDGILMPEEYIATTRCKRCLIL